MSLQDPNVISQFAIDCNNLWGQWNQGPQPGRSLRRQNEIRQAITRMVTFMHPPTVEFKVMSDWGSFNWPAWTLKLGQGYTERDDIKYKVFLEFCSTIYHETRHAEQFYRIAQGLALGRLHFPDTEQSAMINQLAVPVGAGSVRARASRFGGSVGAPPPAPILPDAQLLSTWLSIPLAAATHAHGSRNQFVAFINLNKPAWFKRQTSQLEVEEWMRATYKKTYKKMDKFAQNTDDYAGSPRDAVYRMYRDLPEEHDAHSIEDLVQSDIKNRIGHVNNLSDRRTNAAVFGP